MTFKESSQNSTGGSFIRRHGRGNLSNRSRSIPPDPAYVVDGRRLTECLKNLESLSGE
jgi:hypothetical protein